jgi:hypothetical protein
LRGHDGLPASQNALRRLELLVSLADYFLAANGCGALAAFATKGSPPMKYVGVSLNTRNESTPND